MTEYTLPYGDSSISVRLNERQVRGVLRGKETPPISNIPSALACALDAPVACEPLCQWTHPEDKVALIVSDMSRFWIRQDLVVPHLIDYLNKRCRIPDENITIVIANGTHAGGPESDLRQLVTDAVYERVRVVNHDCLAPDLVTLGTTPHGTTVRINRIAAEADCVITLGACTHHVMAGYGGGRKSILPGISGMDTICHNHAFALDPEVFRSNSLIGNGVTEGNPLNLDMCEAAALVPRLFTVNLVMNADMKLAEIIAGDCQKSWERACRAVDRIYNLPIEERADVIVASCGGFPKDMSLYQGTKAIDNIECCLKPGGTLILVIEAREGGGPPEYFDWIGPLQDGSFEEKLRSHFTIPGYIFLLNCEQAQRYRIMLYSSVKAETVAPMGIESYQNMDVLLANADLGEKRIYVIPNASTVVPYVEENK